MGRNGKLAVLEEPLTEPFATENLVRGVFGMNVCFILLFTYYKKMFFFCQTVVFYMKFQIKNVDFQCVHASRTSRNQQQLPLR